MRRLACVALALLLCPRVSAQEAAQEDDLKVGARVRVELGKGKCVVGILSSLDPARLDVTDTKGRVVGIARADVAKLQISAGRPRHVVKGAIIGGAVGLVLGVLAARGIICASDLIAPPVCENTFDPSLVIVGVIASSAVGILVGAAFRSDRWKDAALPPQASEQQAGVRIAFRVRF